MSYVIKCDRCLRLGPNGEQSHIPQEWANIGLRTAVGSQSFYKWHQFCPECTAHLQIKSDPTEETSAEKLVAILESMVDEAVDERDE